MIWTVPSTFGKPLLFNDICFLIATASLFPSVFVPCARVRRPLTARPPASIHTKLSPRLLSCCSTRAWPALPIATTRSEEHTSELQSRLHLVCRLLLEKKKNMLDVDEVDDDCRAAVLRCAHVRE